LETIGYYAEPMNGNVDFLNLFPMETVEPHQSIESKLEDETFEKQTVSNIFKKNGI